MMNADKQPVIQLYKKTTNCNNSMHVYTTRLYYILLLLPIQTNYVSKMQHYYYEMLNCKSQNYNYCYKYIIILNSMNVDLH